MSDLAGQSTSNTLTNVKSSSALIGLLAILKRVSRGSSRTAVEVSPVMSTALMATPNVSLNAAMT